jgi:putative sterol carrier protein
MFFVENELLSHNKSFIMVASDAVFAKIEARLTKVDKANRKPEMLRTFSFKITDDAGSVIKTWFLDLVNVHLEVAEKSADCTWIVSDKVMTDIGSGTIGIKAAIEQGKLKVEGATDIAGLLEPFVSSL